ncbi:uncharacterized protein LOC134205034 [Armigeres subalbatus]|uniref:uncharacterized protein LOC134205034 n=1 Tax=Armigeres subalbatus TaxID=124917 RepID=UPI002ED0B4DC
MNEESLETASTTTPVAVIPPRCPITPQTIRSTTTIPTTASEPILETTTAAEDSDPRPLLGCSCSCSGGGNSLSELATSTTPTTTDDDLEERKYIFKMKLNYYNIYLVTTSYRKERRFSLFSLLLHNHVHGGGGGVDYDGRRGVTPCRDRALSVVSAPPRCAPFLPSTLTRAHDSTFPFFRPIKLALLLKSLGENQSKRQRRICVTINDDEAFVFSTAKAGAHLMQQKHAHAKYF